MMLVRVRLGIRYLVNLACNNSVDPLTWFLRGFFLIEVLGSVYTQYKVVRYRSSQSASQPVSQSVSQLVRLHTD